MAKSSSAIEIPRDSSVETTMEATKGQTKYSKSMERYIIFLAMSQGFSVMLNLNIVFMTSGTAHEVLGVQPFSALNIAILEFIICVVNVVLFWSNPVKPWLTVIISYCQAVVYALQLIVIATMSGTQGKVMYLICTALLGTIFGCCSITSFSFIAFGPISCLGSLSFGFALGGVIPFFFSTVIQFGFYADGSADSARAIMYALMGFVVVLSFVCAINLTVYLKHPEIKKHYDQLDLDGVTTVKCTFRAAFKGLKYTWKIVFIDFISYMNLLIYYPSIIPISMKLGLVYNVMLIGIFQISDTVGRFLAVFINNKYLPCNTLNRVMILVCCNLGTTAFLACCAVTTVPFLRNIVVISFGVITFGFVNGYCNAYCDKSIVEMVPQTLEQDVIVSTTSVFKIIVSIFCAVGSLVAAFLVPLFQ